MSAEQLCRIISCGAGRWPSNADTADAHGNTAEGEEEARLKVERLRITRMRAQLEAALARLQHERAAFDSHKVWRLPYL